jgi:aspartyl-tRNA(Asn)/glutamyl-tRNA(Gln) amidotransferase subunit C
VKLTENEVRYVADLANLKLTDEEIGSMVKQLGAILEHMERLGEINTDGVEPMRQVLFPAAETATLRDDIPQPTLSNEDALRNAVYPGQGYFRVPRVIER